MAMTPEYEAALDALSHAADEQTRKCSEYQEAAQRLPADSPELDSLRQACDEAKHAHEEALADAWELIEQEPGPS